MAKEINLDLDAIVFKLNGKKIEAKEVCTGDYLDFEEKLNRVKDNAKKSHALTIELLVKHGFKKPDAEMLSPRQLKAVVQAITGDLKN